MSSLEAQLLEDSAEELFEDAPCGYLSTRVDGTIIKVNRTFETWLGRPREELLGRVRFQELLTAGGRIYHDTHYSPLLQMQGTVREIAVELIRADGTKLPALINSVLRRDGLGQAQVVRTTVFDATDRHRYEQELLRASRREREIASALQHSLLSGELPLSPALQVAAHYRPVAPGLEIGGDWYDAFWLDDPRTVVLVVGDVVGRGLGAAAVMGQLRSAVRALASLHLSPSQVLEALDTYSRQHNLGALTTVAYAEVDLVAREVRYSCAGHPPPLLVEPGRKPRFLWDGRSLPVNAVDAPRPRTQATVHVQPGSHVLLYTDGLVEDRQRPLEKGMDQLAHSAWEHRASALEEMVRAAADALAQPEPADDNCLLAARIGG